MWVEGSRRGCLRVRSGPARRDSQQPLGQRALLLLVRLFLFEGNPLNGALGVGEKGEWILEREVAQSFHSSHGSSKGN